MTTALSWYAEREFEVDGIEYCCRPMHDHFESTPTRFCLRKPPDLVRRLERLLADLEPRTIVELGVFEGGSTAFIAQTTPVEKLIAIDIEPPRAALEEMLRAKGLEERVSLQWEVDQADGERLGAIVHEELGGARVDLIVDDASHLLEPTRASFEALFPLLAPGGVYVIEDWAMAHAITNPQPDRTPLSVLTIELVLACGHRPEAIARVDVDGAWVTVTRGDRELGDDFDLREHCGERGRQLLPPPGAGTLAGPSRGRGRGARRLGRLRRGSPGRKAAGGSDVG